jgi:hypothetical protein
VHAAAIILPLLPALPLNCLLQQRLLVLLGLLKALLLVLHPCLTVPV